MGGLVSGEEASVYYSGTEPVVTAVRLLPALGDGGCRCFGDISQLAAFG